MLRHFKPSTTPSSLSANSKPPAWKAKRLLFIVFVLALGLFCACSGGGKSSTSVSSSENVSTESASSQSAAELETVELKATTEYLEYSNKDVDPTSLVKASDSKAKVTTKGTIDLSKVGPQKVAFEVSLDDKVAEKAIEFTVRDTKAPAIKFVNDNPSIDQGGEFDPMSCISSVSDPVDGDLSFVESELKASGTRVGLEQFYDAGWYSIDGSLDSNTPGTYSFVIKASDKHGNVATKELLVKVNEVVQQTEESAPEEALHTYILNKNSGVFHIQGCRDEKRMKDKNKQEINATRQQMIDWGYNPCDHCNP